MTCASISGRLFTDNDGDNTEKAAGGGLEAGIADQVVQLLDAHGNVVKTTTTDEWGCYSFKDVPFGEYAVQFPTSVAGGALVTEGQGTYDVNSNADVVTGRTDVFHLTGPQPQVDAGYRPPVASDDGVAVDGENTGEIMTPGYDDSNAPTDGGGQTIDGADGLDDTILGNGGNDTIDAGAGDDLVSGGSGDDVIEGNAGNDTIFGDISDAVVGDGERQSFNWDLVSSAQADTTVVQDTGSVSVTYMRTTDTGHHESDVDNHTALNVSGIDTSDEAVDANSSLFSLTNGQGNTGAFQWSFSTPVRDVEFNINDLDGDGLVTIRAFDANGDEIPVNLVGGADIQITGNTADAVGPYQDATDPDTTVQVTIPGPVARIELVHTQDGADNSGINITDIYFDGGFVVDPGEAGDDSIDGGAGDDVIYGQGGDDTIDGGTGDDVIYGDNGPGGAPGAGPQNLIVNGSFEDVSGLTTTSYGFVGTGTIPGWTTSNGGSKIDIHNDSRDGQVATDGNNWLDLEGTPGNIRIGQDLANLVAGESYELTFDVSDSPHLAITGPDENVVDVIFGGEVIATIDPSNIGESDFQKICLTLVAGSGDGSDRLEFQGRGLEDNFGAAIDNVQLYALTPEGEPGNPGTVGGDDVIIGGEGADTMFGEGGDDTFIVSSAEEGAGDVIVGGTGPDQNTDLDILDLRGAGRVTIDQQADAEDAGATEGTVTFADGSTLQFDQIEQILTDPQNSAPVAQADAFPVSEDEDPGAPVGNVLDNDSDPEGDPLSVGAVNGSPDNVGQPVPGSNGGLITINPDGTVSFDPDGAFDGLKPGEEAVTTVTYTPVDDSGTPGDPVTVTFTVSGTNDAPVAEMDSFAVTEDDPAKVIGNVLDNDSDPEGDPLSVAAVNGAPGNLGQPVPGSNGGLITINPDGTLSFDPDGAFDALGEGETATTTVTYTVTDPDGATDETSVTITVTGGNDGPVGAMDSFPVSEDEDPGAPVGNVLDNDSDPEGDPLSVGAVNGSPDNVGQPVPGSNGGLITINPDGTVSFDPDGAFDGLKPGEEAVTTVTYTPVDDSGTPGDPVTVTFTVSGTNDAPVAEMDSFAVTEDDPAKVIGNVLDNDSDPEGDPLSVAAVNGAPGNLGQPVPGSNGGLITINPDGTLSFDPDGAFDALGEGETATTTVTYTVTDPDGATDETSVTITVTGGNDGPVGAMDSFPVSEDEDPGAPVGNVLDNDSDPEGDPLSVGAVNGSPDNVGQPVPGSNGGLITINPDGTVSFDPDGAFDGLKPGEEAVTTVTYTPVDDSGTPGDPVTVTFTVSGTNDAPVAEMDSFAVTEDDPAKVIGNVLDNDTDPDDAPDTLEVSAVNGDPANVGAPIPGDQGGLITIAPDGTVTFDPNGEFDALKPGEETTTSVTYTVTDPNGAESTETVTVTVGGINDDPEATNNAYLVKSDEAAGDVDGNVLTDDTGDGKDRDPEEDPVRVVGVGQPVGMVGAAVVGSAGGLFTILEDGTVDFDANGDFDDLGLNETRDTTVEYTISDGQGGTDTATVTFTVGGENDGTITGTSGSDIINPFIPYTDEDGDTVDANDAILPGDTGNDDLILGLGGDDTISAGDGNDEVFGGADNDLINGNAGNDTLSGDEGDDTVNGGLGNDTIFGGTGDDTLSGQDGNDRIEGGDGDDMINGGDGNDVLRGDDGDDKIEGSEGDDTIRGGDGNDDIWGGADDDRLFGGDGDDTIGGGSGNDSITGGEGSDTVEGGSGDDVINTGNHADPATDVDYPGPTIPGLPIADNDPDPFNDRDVVDGGDGNDSITTGDDDDSVIGGAGDDFIDVGIDDDTVQGGDGNDTIIGSQGEDTIEGNDGDDLIYGGLEDEVLNLPDDIDPNPEDNRDIIDGGAGNDTIFGRDDDDTLMGGDGDDLVYGGIDDDTISGNAGDDTLFGDAGDDSVTGNAGNDTVYGGDGNDIVGGGLNDGNDVVYGDAGDDTVLGGRGDDVLYGGTGNDTIASDRGDDLVFGDEGDDSIQGGTGDDTIFGGTGDDTIRSNTGSDSVDGGDGDDTIITFSPTEGLPDQDYPGDGLPADPDPFDDIDVVDGGAGNDVIRTGDDADTIFGGDGDDQIDGGIDNDVITGGAGADDIKGGFGSDTIFGGNGGDVVTGGEDPDDSDIDVLDLTGSGVDRIVYVDGDPEAGTVFFNDGTSMTFSEIERVIPCFTPGTMIATPRGERLVEELQVGDKIITRDNGIQEIAWVGHKHLDGRQLASNPHLKPVLIKAGALGDNLPERDMLVSPNHRVLVASELTQLYFEESEVLAAAKHMTGARGIHAVDVLATTYVHFMFERHEVVLSNGAWTESFQPGDYSLKGIGNGQRNEIFELFPELATKTGLEGYQSARKALKKHEARLLIK